MEVTKALLAVFHGFMLCSHFSVYIHEQHALYALSLHCLFYADVTAWTVLMWRMNQAADKRNSSPLL